MGGLGQASVTSAYFAPSWSRNQRALGDFPASEAGPALWNGALRGSGQLRHTSCPPCSKGRVLGSLGATLLQRPLSRKGWGCFW